MNTTTPKPDQAPQPKPFEPGDSYYQVLALAPLVGPNGETGYQMWGPFPDLASANTFSNTKPGSLITVTLVLHQNTAAVAPPPALGKIQPIK